MIGRYDQVADGFEMAEEGDTGVGYGETLRFFVCGSEGWVGTRRLASRESVKSDRVDEDKN